MDEDQQNKPQEKSHEAAERKRLVEEFIDDVMARVERKRQEVFAAPLASERVQ